MLSKLELLTVFYNILPYSYIFLMILDSGQNVTFRLKPILLAVGAQERSIP